MASVGKTGPSLVMSAKKATLAGNVVGEGVKTVSANEKETSETDESARKTEPAESVVLVDP